MKIALRLVLIFLFALSTLTWFSVNNLFAWELSIVTTQLGWIFAVVMLACIGALLLTRIRAIDVVILALAVIAVGTYVAPIFTTLTQWPGQMNVLQLFKPTESAVPFKRVQYLAANDKTPLNMDIYSVASVARVAKSAPWVLVIHGGGWINGDSEQMPEMNWHLAKEGYTVISIDYRLSPAWLWPAPRDDAYRALAYIRSHAREWNIDPERWVILGRSAGAQVAGVVAYTVKDNPPKGFISYYNPTDLVFGYGVGKEDDILKSRTLLRGFLGGTPEEKKDLYHSASEMELVTPQSPPTLLLHGLKDNIVWEKHSERLFDVLKKNGVDVTMKLFAFGPHGFDYFFNGPEAQASTSAADDFLRRVLPLQ